MNINMKNILLLMFMITSCEPNKFVQVNNANSPNSPNSSNEEHKTLSLSCEKSVDSVFTAGVGNNNNANLNFSPNSKPFVSLHGRFCAQNISEASSSTVLFIVDFSSSMKWNDELKSGSCGRLKAAIKVVNNFSISKDVKFGIIPFAYKVVKNKIVEPIPSSDFVSKLTTGNFCQYLSGTNIQDPLIKAKSEVDIQRYTYIVLITDGEPTVYNGGSKDKIALEKAIEASKNLRRMGNVVFYSLFLDVYNSTTSFDNLAAITGDRSKTFHAQNADQLEILAGKVVPVDISTDNINSTLTIGNKSKSLKITNFDKEGDKSWLFKTEPFELNGDDNKIIPHFIRTSVKNTKGDTVESKVKINFEK